MPNEEAKPNQEPGTPIKSPPKIVSDAMLIAVASLFGYCAYFAREASYLSRFGVSDQFVTVTLSGVVGMVAGLLVACFFLVPALDWITSQDFVKGRGSVIHFVILEVLVFTFWLSILALGVVAGWPIATVAGIAGVVIHVWRVYWIPEEVYPNVSSGSTWRERVMKKHEDRLDRSSTRGVVYVLKAKFGRFPVVIILLGILAVAAGAMWGNWSAQSQTVFGVTSVGSTEYVLVRKYDQNYIFVPLVRKQGVAVASVLALTPDSVARRGLVISFEGLKLVGMLYQTGPLFISFPEKN
jgi:hypothetical protein